MPRTTNQQRAARRSAEHRRCPKCKRGSALGQRYRIPEGSWRVCRYCGHEVGIINGKLFGFSPETEPGP